MALLLLVQTLVAPAMAASTCSGGGCGTRVETIACETVDRCGDAAVAGVEQCSDEQCADESACADESVVPADVAHADACGHESSDDGCAEAGCARLCACCPVLAPHGAQASLVEIPSVDPQSFPPAPVASPFALASSVDHPPCW